MASFFIHSISVSSSALSYLKKCSLSPVSCSPMYDAIRSELNLSSDITADPHLTPIRNGTRIHHGIMAQVGTIIPFNISSPSWKCHQVGKGIRLFGTLNKIASPPDAFQPVFFLFAKLYFIRAFFSVCLPTVSTGWYNCHKNTEHEPIGDWHTIITRRRTQFP